MARTGSLEYEIEERINGDPRGVWLREDFEDLGGYDQVGRALKKLGRKEKILKIGYGLYAKAKKSSITGNIIPIKSLPELAKEALGRLGVKVLSSTAEREYREGVSMQVPTGRYIGVRSRVIRKIGYQGKYIEYERISR